MEKEVIVFPTPSTSLIVEEIHIHKIHKAGLTITPIHNTCLVIGLDLPGPSYTPTQDRNLEEIYQQDADQIVETLSATLPQATLERVLIGLLGGACGMYRGIRR